MERIIYGLHDPSDSRGVVRYVGCSKHIDRRLIEHLCEARDHATHRHRWINSVLAKGQRPEVTILEIVADGDDWRDRERHWIVALAGNRLVNATAGGDGLCDPSPEVRAKISATVSAGLQGNQRRRGVPQSVETRQKIADGVAAHIAAGGRKGGRAAGFTLSAETREKVAASKRGKKRTPFTAEARANMAAARRGKKQAPETIAKRAASLMGNQNARGVIKSASTKAAISAARTGGRWITDGAVAKYLPAGESLPDGWTYGRATVPSHPT